MGEERGKGMRERSMLSDPTTTTTTVIFSCTHTILGQNGQKFFPPKKMVYGQNG